MESEKPNIIYRDGPYGIELVEYRQGWHGVERLSKCLYKILMSVTEAGLYITLGGYHTSLEGAIKELEEIKCSRL